MPRILYDLTGANDLRFSPNCWRSRMALAHKGLDAECEPCRFIEKDKIAFSGQTRLPVLRDGERVVADSWNIACYLEDAYPDGPSLFGGGVGCGVTRHLNAWVNNVLHPAVAKTFLADIHDSLDPEDREYFRKTREKRFGAPLEEVSRDREGNLAALRCALAPTNDALDTQDWICGEAPAYGDYLVFGALQWARAVGRVHVAEPGAPLHAWNERMLDLYDGLGRKAVPAAKAA